jgi:hypothetical protein
MHLSLSNDAERRFSTDIEKATLPNRRIFQLHRIYAHHMGKIPEHPLMS